MTITSTTITNTAGTSMGNGYVIKNGQGDQLLFYNGFLVQKVDANGNKIYFIYNSASNASGTAWLPTTATTNKLTKVIQRNDGASSDIVLATLTYNSSNQLLKVTDRAGYSYTLTYESSNLETVSSTNGYSAKYTYDGGYLDEAIDVAGKYKIDYDFENGRISAFTEKAGDSWTTRTQVVVVGSRDKTTYQYSGEDGVITDLSTSSASTIANSDDLLTTYLFDDEGRTINSNTTNANQTVVYGAATGAYATSSGTENANNHLLNSASIGATSINLLPNSSFETTDSSGWTLYKSSSTGMNMVLSTDGHRTGNSALKTYFSSSTTGTLRAYRSVSSLVKGETYTLSAYVNTTEITSFGSGGGIYLSVTSGSTTTSSDTVDYVTASAMDSGWTRISVTFTASATSATVNVYIKNAVGIAYIDDLQLEKDDAPSNVNLVSNGAMEGTTGWTVKTTNVSTSSAGIGGSKATAIASTPIIQGYLYQTIPINLPYTETYVLSGWAKADALPANQPLYYAVKLFTLKAEVYYSDGSMEEFFLPFSAEIDGEWQFASRVIVPSKKYTVTKILVYCAYHYNVGTALFDNISLVREPAQTMTYDSSGYLTSVATPGLSSDTNTYSGGNLIKTVTSGNGTYTYTYDSYHNLKTATNGVVTQTNTYNSAGNATKTVLSGSSGTETITTSATYSTEGNQILTVTDALGNKTTSTYGKDLNLMYGLPSSVTDAKSTKVSYIYNANGTTSSQSITDVVSLSYSYTNQLLSKVARTGYDPNGNTISQTYNLTYDDFGQLTKVQVGTAWTLIANEYNSAGFLEKQTYGNGDYLEYTYDELGRVKETTTETGKTVTYAYTADGQLGSVDMGTTLSYDYLYDSLGRLITSSRHDSGELVLKTRHEYDTSNRLSKQHLNLVDKTYSESYTYDSYGRVSSMTSGNGTTITYTYDALSRLSTVTTPVYKITYTYTEGSTQVENISYSAVNSNRMEALSFSLEYDELGNIVSRDYDTLFGSLSIKYDEQGQVLSQIGTSKTYTHTYDTCGNRVSSQNKLGSHTYTYGNSDWKDLLTAFDGGSITYDASGNPTSYYNGTRWTFTWANGRELTKAVSSGHTITYSYDGDGLRLSKTVDGVVYNYVYASGKLIRETIGDDVVMDFFYDANGQPYAFSYNGLMLYYILNPQGDVQRIVNSAGTAYVSYSYDEWGYVTWCTDNDYGNNNPLRYRGYVYDTETGFYYLQSRYYDPAIGRFINADSFVSTGQDFIGYNMFAYCGNNPTTHEDSSGAWFGSVLVGLGTQYIADVIGNLADKKSGWDVLKPTSSIGEYVAAGVTALIPGKGVIGSLVRNVVTEGILIAEGIYNGDGVDWGQSAFNITLGTIGDTLFESVTDKVGKLISSKLPRNYSSFAGDVYEKNPNATRTEIYERMQRAIRTNQFISDVVSVGFDVLRNCLPY